MTELKRGPFCGSSVELREYKGPNSSTNRWCILCKSCEIASDSLE